MNIRPINVNAGNPQANWRKLDSEGQSERVKEIAVDSAVTGGIGGGNFKGAIREMSSGERPTVSERASDVGQGAFTRLAYNVITDVYDTITNSDE